MSLLEVIRLIIMDRRLQCSTPVRQGARSHQTGNCDLRRTTRIGRRDTTTAYVASTFVVGKGSAIPAPKPRSSCANGETSAAAEPMAGFIAHFLQPITQQACQHLQRQAATASVDRVQ